MQETLKPWGRGVEFPLPHFCCLGRRLLWGCTDGTVSWVQAWYLTCCRVNLHSKFCCLLGEPPMLLQVLRMQDASITPHCTNCLRPARCDSVAVSIPFKPRGNESTLFATQSPGHNLHRDLRHPVTGPDKITGSGYTRRTSTSQHTAVFLVFLSPRSRMEVNPA